MERTTSFTFRINSDGIRTEEVKGTTYKVVPVVALVEGVIWPVNAPSPELALASEFGKFPGSWDGRPVVMGHPEVGGIKVSANRVDVLSDGYFGHLFNTYIGESDTVGKFLASEIWIDESKVGDNEAVKASIERMAAGEDVEVSVGTFVELDSATGEFKGKGYEGVWRNVVPDHLAILPEGTRGACSNEMGCGAPRTASHNNNPEDKYIVAMPQFQCASDGAGQLRILEAKDVSEWRQAESDCACKEKGPIQKALEAVSKILPMRFRSNELSDVDKRTAISVALEKKLGNTYFWIVAVFSDKVVYESYDSGLIQVDYTISSDGSVTIGDNSISVRPETQFVAAKEEDMNKAGIVTALIASSATAFEEGDKEQLMALDEKVLAKMLPKATATPEVTASVTEASRELAGNSDETLDSFLAKAPKHLQGQLTQGISTYNAQKASVIKSLTENANCGFTVAELQNRDLEELNKMAKLAGASANNAEGDDNVDYSLVAIGEALKVSSAKNAIPDPEPLFPTETVASK